MEAHGNRSFECSLILVVNPSSLRSDMRKKTADLIISKDVLCGAIFGSVQISDRPFLHRVHGRLSLHLALLVLQGKHANDVLECLAIRRALCGGLSQVSLTRMDAAVVVGLIVRFPRSNPWDSFELLESEIRICSNFKLCTRRFMASLDVRGPLNSPEKSVQASDHHAKAPIPEFSGTEFALQ